MNGYTGIGRKMENKWSFYAKGDNPEHRENAEAFMRKHRAHDDRIERLICALDGRINRLEEERGMLMRRIEQLETENACYRAMKSGTDSEAELVLRYGAYVDKTTAGKILNVSRATVYAMLADQRITGACGGSRVDVRSLARYLSSERKPLPQGTETVGVSDEEA